MILRSLVLSLCMLAMIVSGCEDPETNPELPEPVANASAGEVSGGAPQLKEAKLGTTPNVHVYEQCYLAGQPSVEDMKAAKEAGIKTVINLIPAEDQPYDEAAAAKKLGLHYISLPIDGTQDLTDEFLTRAREELKNAPQPLIMHCGAAGRVGALWMAKRALDDGLSTEAAVAEANEVGLRNDAMRKRVIEYIEKHREK